MKKMVVFVAGLFLLIGLLGVASAYGCEGDSKQQIVRFLSNSIGTTNAHGALWNQEGISLCYNELFSSGSYDSNPRDECDEDNTLFYLNNESNAHISLTNSSVYNIPVCHEGLKNCELKSCSSDKCINLIWISDETNAHISSKATIGYSPISCECVGSNCSTIKRILGPYGCEDFSGSETECEDYGTPAIASLDYKCKAKNKDSCECVWDVNTAAKCSVQWEGTDGTSSGPGGGSCSYICTVSGTEVTECSGNSKIMRTTAKVTSSDGKCIAPAGVCQSSSATIPCGDAEEASLPFFGVWQIVTSLMAIAFVYCLINRKRLF